MIIGDDTQGTNTGFNQERSEDGFNLCLAGFKVIPADKRFLLLGEFDTARNKRILWSTIDERNTL